MFSSHPCYQSMLSCCCLRVYCVGSRQSSLAIVRRSTYYRTVPSSNMVQKSMAQNTISPALFVEGVSVGSVSSCSLFVPWVSDSGALVTIFTQGCSRSFYALHCHQD